MAQALTNADLRAFRARVVDDDIPQDDADRIDQLTEIEKTLCALQARQARIAAEFDASQRRKAAEAGVPAARQGRGIGHQVALARRESPVRGSQHLGLAKVLTTEMPHTKAAFDTGAITEWRAMVMVRETACLDLPHRQAVDQALAHDAAKLERMSDRELLAEVRRLAAKLDPAAVARRRRRAETERHLTIRPAPDTMVYLTALLPVKEGVAAWASLKATADLAAATGAATSRGQVMADTLVERITGRSTTEPAPVELNLVMTDGALLDQADDLAHLAEWGPIPADLAREIVADALDARAKVALRRLFTRPDSGQLVSMESRGRLFPQALAKFIRLRDQFCRNPWCNGLIRHTDHVEAAEDGGPTTADNGQGLCESCNHAKQAPGWRATAVENVDGHTVETTTPTGHTYRSQAPPITGPPRWPVKRMRWSDFTTAA